MGKELGDCMNYNRCDINKLENYFREMGYIRLDYVVNPKTKESFKCKEKYGITLLYHDKKAVVIVYCPMVYMYKTGQLDAIKDDISENLQGFDLANVLYVFVGDNRCHAIKGSNVISIDESQKSTFCHVKALVSGIGNAGMFGFDDKMNPIILILNVFYNFSRLVSRSIVNNVQLPMRISLSLH